MPLSLQGERETHRIHRTHRPHRSFEVEDETGETRRMNLTFQPSTVEAIDKIAFLRRTSVNDLINTVLKEYAAAHTDEIQKYDTIFPKED